MFMRAGNLIAAMVSILALFVVVGMVANEIGNLSDTTSLSGGLDTFFDRATILYLFVAGMALVAGMLMLITWLRQR